jgi:PAS domain S-box-containing protein
MNPGCLHAEQVDHTMGRFVQTSESVTDGAQVMFVPSRRRRTDSCGAGRRKFSVVASRYVVRPLEVCLLLLLTCSYAAALESDRSITQFVHTAWGAKEGAPNVVGELAQSSDGYIWLGTPNGLYRFDGAAFEHYQPQSGGPFPEGAVTSLLALPNGDLWIGFRPGGISLLRNGNATNYTVGDGVPEGYVRSMVEDREGAIWAASTSGLSRLEGGKWKQVGKEWNFPGKVARTLFIDREGTLWAAADDTVVFLRPDARKFQLTGIRVREVTQIAQAPNGKMWMADTGVAVRPIPLSDNRQPPDVTDIEVGSQGILFDKDGAFWIATLGDGLRRSQAPDQLRGQIKRLGTEVESYTAKDGLSDDYARSILQDREGNIWIGTNNGLDCFRKTNLAPVDFPAKLQQALGVAGDAGDVWIEDLLTMFRVHGGHVDRGYSFPSQAVSAYRDPEGVIWWLSCDGIYRNDHGKYTKIALPPQFPKPFMGMSIGAQATNDGSGALWLAAVNEGIFYWKKGVWLQLEAASEFAKLVPRAAFTDWMGRAWFGYESGTILVLDQGKIQRVFPADASPVGTVRAINGLGRHIWVGGRLGLAFFDGNRFQRIVPADAEAFGRVMGIEETPDGSLWLAESRGVIQVPASEVRHALDNASYRVKYRLFDSFDGIRGSFEGTRSDSKEIRGSDGKLWFFASNGIVRVDPANVSTNALPPPVFIRSVRANGRLVDSLRNLILPPRTNALRIDYTALSLSVPEKVRFRYRLEEVDQDWQDAGTLREAFYTRLGPGAYHFQVIACNNDGVWNEEGARLDFVIAPAWYQTIWFRGLYVLAFIALLWAGYQMRIHQLQEQEGKFRDAVEAMPALAFVADPKGNRTFFNRGWLEYTGLSSEQAAGSGWEAAIHPDDLKPVTERWRSSRMTGEPLEYEARLRRGSDGVYRWFQTRARSLRDNRGKIVKWCAVANDIEDRKDAERLRADLTHASRVSTMGELVASISHELAQPITVTTNHAKASLQWLKRDPPNLTEVRKGTEKIIEAGAFASEIINRLRSLYKKSPPQRELVDVNGIIREMVLLLRGEANGHAVSIRTDFAPDLPKITADGVQLQQLVMNLILNGTEVMKDTGGVLTMKSQLSEGGQIQISIHDTGPGLPAGKADRIFDAFFTTKPQGSGMGLAICKSIVESHGGRIWASGEGRRGATFYFTLPVAPAETNPRVDVP